MKRLLATLLILCSGPVWAEWVLIGERGEPGTPGYGQVFYDPSTIQGKEIKRFWVKETGPIGLKKLTEIDCREQKIRSLQTTLTSGPNGEIVSTLPVPTPWVYPDPDNSWLETIKRICGKK